MPLANFRETHNTNLFTTRVLRTRHAVLVRIDNIPQTSYKTIETKPVSSAKLSGKNTARRIPPHAPPAAPAAVRHWHLSV
jgi:hypothetical protein